MKYCWFCRDDIHAPSIRDEDQSRKPAYKVNVFDSSKSINKPVFICQFCYEKVKSCQSSKGLRYSNQTGILANSGTRIFFESPFPEKRIVEIPTNKNESIRQQWIDKILEVFPGSTIIN